MYILIDIGGTKTRVAATGDLERFGEPLVVETLGAYSSGIEAISGAVRSAASDKSIACMMVGIRGNVSRQRGAMRDTDILKDWSEKPVAADLARACGASSVYLENDTALAGLGEAVFGAGSGSGIVAYVTVSTGVNGVRVVDGRIDRAAQGFEIGGQYLDMDPARTLEELVSGRAVEKRFGMHPRELGGDHAVWEELARIVAFGVHNTILHWSPERVVLGGSMFNDVGIGIERVAAHVREIMRKFPAVPPIVHASLGDLGGLWGGMARLKQLQ